MKVKVKTVDVVNGNDVMQRIALGITDVPTRYTVLLNDKAIQPVVETYNTVRQSLIEKYADKTEDGQTKTNEAGLVVWREGEEDALKAELDELNKVENELSIKLIPIEKFASVINYDKVDPALVDVIGGDKVLTFAAINQIAWILE